MGLYLLDEELGKHCSEPKSDPEHRIRFRCDPHFGVDAGLALTAKSISFPLRHPPSVSTSSAHAMQLQRRFYTPGILSRIRRKLLSQIGLDAD